MSLSPSQSGPLLPFLLTALAPMNRTRVKQLLTHGRIHVNGKSTTKHNHLIHPHDHITIDRSPVKPNPTLTILYEDEAMIAIDKPAGLLTVATETEKLETAFVLLSLMLPIRPAIVHRLDRETSGLLLFAKSHDIREKLQAAWDTVEKTYLAIVEGVPQPPAGTIENHLTEGKSLRMTASLLPNPDSKHAITRYRLIKTKGQFSLIEVVIETGRKHQIRVHLAGKGCPIIGDENYGSKSNPAKRLGLHAHRLAFDHPITGKRLVLESPMPTSLNRIV